MEVVSFYFYYEFFFNNFHDENRAHENYRIERIIEIIITATA